MRDTAQEAELRRRLLRLLEAERTVPTASDVERARLRDEAGRLAMAITRCMTGEYGRCVYCDAAIAPARLRDDPARIHCDRCAVFSV